MKYKIVGEPLPAVICDVEPGETLITEGGAMSWMSPNMKMETTSGGGLGKMFGRMFSGDSLFLNRYTSAGGPGQIAFASSMISTPAYSPFFHTESAYARYKRFFP